MYSAVKPERTKVKTSDECVEYKFRKKVGFSRTHIFRNDGLISTNLDRRISRE